MLKKLPTEWNLKLLFKNSQDPEIPKIEKEITKATKSIAAKWRPHLKQLSQPKVLLSALNDLEGWYRIYGSAGRPGYYAALRFWLAKNDPVSKAAYNRINELADKMQSEIQFLILAISKLPVNVQKKALQSKDLQKYRHYLENLFNESKHLLSEPEEKILLLKSGVAYEEWVNMVSGFIAKESGLVLGEDGKTKKRSFQEILNLLNSRKQKVRDGAAREMNAILLKHRDTAEAELNAILADKKINDELRGFARPDASRLLSDDISPDTVDALSEAVSESYDISRRYYRLKARLLGKKVLEYHERNIPTGEIRGKYSYQDSVQIVREILKNLDGELESIFNRLVANGQYDVYPKVGKSGGAFCANHGVNDPTFVLLNHNNELKDVTTLAHETGHALNSELMRGSCHALDFGTPLSTAEVASTFLEDFVYENLINSLTGREQLTILMEQLNEDVSTIFRQIACYRFELELHKEFRARGYLSHKEVGKLFLKHMSEYMGSAVRQSPGSENWWIYWGHIRRYFYNYSYANGLIIGRRLGERVRENKQFISSVKKFLSAGCSKSPKQLFSEMGLETDDPDFWKQGLRQIESRLKMAEKLAQKLSAPPQKR